MARKLIKGAVALQERCLFPFDLSEMDVEGLFGDGGKSTLDLESIQDGVGYITCS